MHRPQQRSCEAGHTVVARARDRDRIGDVRRRTVGQRMNRDIAQPDGRFQAEVDSRPTINSSGRRQREARDVSLSRGRGPGQAYPLRSRAWPDRSSQSVGGDLGHELSSAGIHARTPATPSVTFSPGGTPLRADGLSADGRKKAKGIRLPRGVCRTSAARDQRKPVVAVAFRREVISCGASIR